MEQVLKVDKNGMYYYDNAPDDENEDEDEPIPDPLKRNIK